VLPLTEDWATPECIAALADGSSLITGYFAQTAVFGPGDSNETSLEAVDDSDIFVAKYNPDSTLGRLAILFVL
jgi:hypothetical protein